MMESEQPGVPNLVYCNLTKRLFDPNIEVNYGLIYNQNQEGVWFEVVKDDYNGYYNQNPRKIDFSKINYNIGNCINNGTKQFIATIKGWYEFSTSGRSYYYQSYVKVKTIRNDGRTDSVTMYRGDPYSNHKDSFTTTTFSRDLEIGDKIEVWEFGYKFRSDVPFRFTGHLVPEAQ